MAASSDRSIVSANAVELYESRRNDGSGAGGATGSVFTGTTAARLRGTALRRAREAPATSASMSTLRRMSIVSSHPVR